MKLKPTFLLILLFFSSHNLFNEELEVTYSKSIDWGNGIITIDITTAGDTPWTKPSSRYNMDRLISKRAPVLSAEAVSDITLDSLDTIGSAILNNTSLYGNLLNLTEIVGKTFSTASEDSKSLTVRYNIPIFPDIASLFINQKIANPVPIDLRYKATVDFTGIIIYAGELLPLLGTNKRTNLIPSVFPKIYDENLNIILDLSMVEPEYLQRWGTAGFSFDENKEYYGDRVGIYPLRTMAKAIFGKNKTDLIIPERAIRELLSNDHNRKLLAEGRVLIICSN